MYVHVHIMISDSGEKLYCKNVSCWLSVICHVVLTSMESVTFHIFDKILVCCPINAMSDAIIMLRFATG